MTTATEGLRPSDDEYDTLNEDVVKGVDEGNQKFGYGGGPRTLTVSEALRIRKGYYRVVGQIITVSSVYNMVIAINLECYHCGTEDRREYNKKPIYAPPTRGFKCINCGEGEMRITPEWISVIDVELQDHEKFNDIERLNVKLFEENTIDVRAGEIVAITGNLDPEKKGEGRGKYFTMLYSESIEYTRREKLELTPQDVEDIGAWKTSIEEKKQDVIEALVQKFAPTVVGNEFAKKALLLAGVNAGIKNDDNRDPRRLRINALLVGDPSLAKSVMLRKIVDLIPNARYESAQGSTGISLTFMIAKEGDAHVLRLGPIPLANGSLCGINEMGQMPLEQQKHFLDFAEEGCSSNNKHGINAHIVGNTSLIGSANPYGSRWKHPNEIDLDEIPILSQIIERIDILVVFRETHPDRQKDREYLNAITKIRKSNEAGVFSGYDEFLKKYLMHARTFNPPR